MKQNPPTVYHLSMERKMINEMQIYLDDLRKMQKDQAARLKAMDYTDIHFLKRKKAPDGGWYYYLCQKGMKKAEYIGKGEDSRVKEIKMGRYISKSLEAFDNNIRVIECALQRMKRTDYEHINVMLPETYSGVKIDWSIGVKENAAIWKEDAEALKKKRPVFRPEELIVDTDDGSAVRSKSEGMIYNYLLSRGVAFVYELPTRVGSSTYYPDFTLLSEIDGKTEIIIEHQGMMGNEYYRTRFTEKLHAYLKAGYVPGVNIFFTFDKDNGGFDKTPIEDIVRNKIKM